MLRLRSQVVADAGLNIPESGHIAAVEQLDIRFFNRFALRAIALGFEPNLVEVPAVPGLCIPCVGIGRIGEAGFKPVEQHGAEQHVQVHGVGKACGCVTAWIAVGRRICRHCRLRKDHARHAKKRFAKFHHDTSTTRNMPISMW